jgi:hypothetical protein
MAAVVAVVGGVALALPSVEACSFCDDPDRDKVLEWDGCDGLARIHHRWHYCSDDPSPLDCPTGTVCYSPGPDSHTAQCVTPCTTDQECAPAGYCGSEKVADGRGWCRPFSKVGEPCDEYAVRCAPGLECPPHLIYSAWNPLPDAGVDAGDAGHAGDAGDAGGIARVPPPTCQDCSKIDPATRTCPAGVKSVCRGNSVMQCVCGVPSFVSTECVACVEGDAKESEAYCTLSTTPDPACPAGSPHFYCAGGGVVVRCQDGYASQRLDCATIAVSECASCPR